MASSYNALKLYKHLDNGTSVPFPDANSQIELLDWQYDAKRMGGAPLITATIKYPTCLDDLWGYGLVYVTYKGEEYILKQTPTSSYSNEEIVYKHEVEFISERYVLDNVYFYDVVSQTHPDYKPVTNSTKFSFFGDINEFVARLNASFTYSNVGYSVVVDDDVVSDALLVSFEDKYMSEVLQEGYKNYGIPFYFVGKVVHYGYTSNVITHPIKYGVDQALLSIQKTNANTKVVTRITGVGSADNIPYWYPNDYESKEEVEAHGGTWIEPQANLMPPIYRESLGAQRFYNALNNTYPNPSGGYYTFTNPYVSGRQREWKEDFEDIKPTIKGMTNANGQRIDMFSAFAYDLNDSDEVDADGNYLHPYFFAKLRRMDGTYGFNLFDHSIDEEEMTIAITGGTLGACEFVIGVDEESQKNPVQVDENGNLVRDAEGNVVYTGVPQERQNDTQNYEVWVALRKDINTFGVIMPNATNNYKPNVSDTTFVILHIDLPKAYILAAEDRLKDALIRYMVGANNEHWNFSIGFSRIFFEENPSVLSELNENARVQVEYNNHTYELYISSYTYKKDGNVPLPQITVELAEELSISENPIQQAIDGVRSDILNNIGGSADFLKLGLRYFLRKDVDDIARGKITFQKGLQIGSTFTSGLLGEGGKFWKDEGGNVRLETDYMTVRKKFVASEVDIQDIHHVGGQMLLTAARMICERVEWLDNNGNVLEQVSSNESNVKSYKCYFKATDSDGRKVYNEWMVGDQAFVNTFNLEQYTDGTGQTAFGNHYYWRLVTNVSNAQVNDEHYIVLSATDCDAGSSIPLAGDEIVQLGYRGDDNTGRQSAIIIAGANADDTNPFIREHMGINSYSLANTVYTSLQPGNNFLTGVLTMQAGSTLADGRPINELGTEEGNLVRNSGFTGEYESEPTNASLSVNADTPIYSDPFRYWDKSGNVVVSTSSDTVSGMKAVLSGNASISQNLGNLEAGWYMLSFYADPTSMTFTFAGQSTAIPANGEQRYEFPIELSEDTSNVYLSFIGNGYLGDIMLTRGTISREWKPSVMDNDKAYSEFLSRDYIYRAITEATTSILGGLVLTQLIKVGNYRDGSMYEETGGMSGRYNNDDSPFLWGGGSMEQAFYTIAKYSENPNYNATEAEIANMAKFVVTHGGRAILNDIILRGYIYAIGGVFENVKSKNGKWIIDSLGNVTLEGTIKSESGRIAGFRIQGKELTNTKDDGTPEDDAKIVVKNGTKGYYAAIGWLEDSLISSSGNARNVAQFYNRFNMPYGDGAPVIGIDVLANGANTPRDNIAIVMGGGCISGFAIRTIDIGFPYIKYTGEQDPYESSGSVAYLNTWENDVYVTTQYLYRTGNALDYTPKQCDVYIFLPHMYLNNDGFVFKFKRGFEGDSTKKVYIIPSTGTYRIDNGVEYVYSSGDTCIYSGRNKFSFPSSVGDDRYSLNNPGDYVEFVYHASLEYTKDNVTYHGIWLEHSLSINSNNITT